MSFLHEAVERNEVDVLEVLIVGRDADLNAWNRLGWTP